MSALIPQAVMMRYISGMGKKLMRAFYGRGAEVVARELIGGVLVRRWRGKLLRGRIVETEAYVGAHDLACHASKGKTARNAVMFGPAGHAYVYFIYGMYYMLNFVCSVEGDPQAVLIRAAEALDGWGAGGADLSGPGKLARAMHITRADNGTDLTGEEIYVVGDPEYRAEVARSKRIGVEYAKHWAHEELRFYDSQSQCVSARRPKHEGTKSRRDTKERQGDAVTR